MEFGQIPSLNGIDLSLPHDSARTEKFLALPRGASTRLYVGCPIWASKNWEIYQKGTKPTEFLSVYSEWFNTVEVNSTFYNMLGPDRIAHWKNQTPEGFKFCPKVFRGITENVSAKGMPALVDEFCKNIRAFGNRLGLAFAQFSDRFSLSQLDALAVFLKTWPKDIPLAIELRHGDWFQNHALRDDIVNLFYRHRVSSVITDTPGRRDVLHLSLTQPKVLIRFQGNEGDSSDEDRLVAWGARLKRWMDASLEEIYFFTHQPSDQRIPMTARLAEKKFDLPLASVERFPKTLL